MSEEIGLNVAIGGDPSGGERAIDAMKSAGEDYMRAVVQQSAQVVRSLDTIVDKLGDLGKKQQETKESADKMGSEIAESMAKLAAEVFTVEKAFEFLKDTVKEVVQTADQLRDLQASLQTLSSSAQAGREAWKFFDEAQAHSRNTAQELAVMYRDVLPVAMKRFGEEGTREITMMLSQMAPIVGQTAQGMEDAFKQLLLGRVRGTNPLLIALGMTKEDFKEAGGFTDAMLEHMRRLAQSGEDLGQTFESTFHKIKSEWFDAMADGFNDMRGNANSGMEAIRASLTSPEVIEAFHAIGGATATWAGNLAGVIIELKGIGIEIGNLTTSDNWRAFMAFATLGLSEAVRGAAYAAGVIGQAGNEQAAADVAAARKTAGAGVLRGAGLAELTPAGLAATQDISAFGESGSVLANIKTALPGLEKYIGDLIATDKMTADQIKTFTDQLKNNAADAKKSGVSVNVDDVMASAKQAASQLSIHDKKTTGANEPDDTTAADTKAMQEQVKLLQEKLTLNKEALAEGYKVIQAEDAGNKLALEHDKIGYDNLVKQLDLTARIAQEKLKLQDEEDRGATQEVANSKIHIADLEAQLGVIADTSVALNALADKNYWKTISAQEVAELTKADDAMNQFIAHTQDKLSTMAPNVAASVRASLQANKEGMDMELQSLAVFSNFMGFKMDPESARQIEAFWRQKNDNDLHTGERINKAYEDTARKVAQIYNQTASQFGSELTSIIESGGENFVKILSSGMRASVAEGVKSLTDELFGKQGNPSEHPGQRVDHRYDSQGNDITGRAALGKAALDAAQIGAAGYQAGQSGTPGTRTASELGGAVSGAVAGAQMGAILGPYGAAIGAVAGFAIAAIGGYFGAQQRQADYKYGIPEIDTSGVAHFADSKNYTDEAARQVVRQIQSVYDSVHDSLAMILIKAGALVPAIANINGKFQDNPSGHYEEHLQQYLSGTLPTELLNDFKKDLSGLAETFGVSNERFSAIFGALNNLDPQKAIQLLATMFDALKSLNDVYAINHAQVATPAGDFFSPYTKMYQDTEMAATRNPGQVLSKMDDEILRLAGGLRDLSPENQITTLGQIASLNQNRYQAELQMVQQLYSVVKQIGDQADASVESFEAQKILKADGTPDQYGLSQFYKSHADQDLRDIQGAHNAQELAAAWAKYQQDVQAAEQSGYSQDPTRAGKQGWSQWGIDSVKLGRQIAEGIAHTIGATLNPEDAAFNAKFDPLIDLFKNGIKKLFDPKPGGGDGGGPGEDPIHKANSNLVTNTNTVADTIRVLGNQLAGLTSDIAMLRGEIQIAPIYGPDRTTPSSQFIRQISASRA